MSLLCILEPGQKKHLCCSKSPRTCITFRWHQTLYLNVILQEHRKGFWRLLDTSYLTSPSFNTVFTRSIQASHFFFREYLYIFSIPVLFCNFPTFCSPLSIRSAHCSTPRAGSWLYIRHIPGQKGNSRLSWWGQPPVAVLSGIPVVYGWH